MLYDRRNADIGGCGTAGCAACRRFSRCFRCGYEGRPAIGISGIMFIVSFVLINDIKKTEWSFFRVAVRIAGGFIRNNHLWIMGRRMGNAHTLLLTAGLLQHLALCGILVDPQEAKGPGRSAQSPRRMAHPIPRQFPAAPARCCRSRL